MPHDFRPISEKTVDELEGHAPKPAHDSRLVAHVEAARRVPLGDLSVEQLRLLIGQGQAVSRLAPVALERLEGNPLVAGDFHPGDLLVTLLRAAPRWVGLAGLRERARAVVEQALGQLEQVRPVNRDAGEAPDPDEPDEMDRQRLEPDLRAALEELRPDGSRPAM